MLALAITLMLGLGEPIACIVHCQIWLPFVFHSFFAAHQHHHHHNMPPSNPAAAQSNAPVYGHAQTAPPSSLAPICEIHGGQSDGAPFHPPSPVHEMLPAFGPPLALVIVLLVYLIGPPGTPPNRSISPLLRPPIAFAV